MGNDENRYFWLHKLAVMVSASFDDLETPIYLLYEDQVGESVGHDKFRELEELYSPRSTQYIDVDTIAPTDDEYEILALIATLAECICECDSIHRITPLITEDGTSLEFAYFLDQLLCFFSLDIGDFCMFDGLDGMDFDIFGKSLPILANRFREVFLAI